MKHRLIILLGHVKVFDSIYSDLAELHAKMDDVMFTWQTAIDEKRRLTFTIEFVKS